MEIYAVKVKERFFVEWNDEFHEYNVSYHRTRKGAKDTAGLLNADIGNPQTADRYGFTPEMRKILKYYKLEPETLVKGSAKVVKIDVEEDAED